MEAIVERLLRHESLPDQMEISVLFTNNEAMQRLNREFRNVDAPTDVLAFPQISPEELAFADRATPLILGDVAISTDRAREQARELGHSIKQEVALLLTHGILHLVGYDHGNADEAEHMSQAEREILAGSAYLDRAS